jgi:hypothetical protein
VASTLPLLVTAGLLRALGVGVPAVTLGAAWRPRLSLRLGDTTLVATPWLVTSNCVPKDHDNLEQFGGHPGRCFGDLPALLRLVVVAAGPLAVVGGGVLVLGPEGFASFVHGFEQVVAGAASPFGHAQALLGRYWQAAGAAPVATGVALVAKLMALQLLPLPPLPGGNALLQGLRGRRPSLPPVAMTLTGVGLLAVLALLLGWALALGVFLLRLPA